MKSLYPSRQQLAVVLNQPPRQQSSAKEPFDYPREYRGAGDPLGSFENLRCARRGVGPEFMAGFDR
jgi:hypothetical protein